MTLTGTKRSYKMPNMTTPWKHPRTGVYYYRKGIPQDVREYFDDKREVKRSLGTKSLSDAKRLILPHIEEIERKITHHRDLKDSSLKTNLTQRDLAVLAEKWLKETVERVEREESWGDYISRGKHIHDDGSVETMDTLITDFIDVERDSNSAKAKLFRQSIDQFFSSVGIVIPYGSENYLLFAEMFVYKYLELEKICEARLNLDFVTQPNISVLANESVTSVEPRPALKDGECISVVFELYESYAESMGITRKTIDETSSIVNRFISAFGDIIVTNIKRATIQDFQQLMRQLPSSQAKRVKSLPVKEQADLAKRERLKTLSEKTVRKNMRLLSTIFSYAVDRELITDNPAFNLKFKYDASNNSDRERDYKPNEIAKIFQHEVFQTKDTELKYGAGCYWIPLLAYYTGARSQELGQLEASDVRESEGIFYISFNIDGSDKFLKNRSSHRDIPIHPHLIELGFVEYARSLVSTSKLFPEIPLDKNNHVSTSFARWFKKQVLTGVGLGSIDAPPIHGFRHTIRTTFREMQVPNDVSDSITGHSDGSVSRTYGRFTLKAKLNVIQQLPFLDLDKIIP